MRILYGNSPITFGDSLWITIVSMAIVFLVLILISSILSLLKYLPAGKGKKENKKNINKSGVSNSSVSLAENKKIKPEDIKDDRMLAAVTVAVIDAAGETENAYIRVKSIREIN